MKNNLWKKLLCGLLCSLLMLGCVTPAFAAESIGFDRPVNAHIAFNNGELKILQVADIQDGATLNPLCKELLRAVIDKTQPDLIMLTGDNIAGYACTLGNQAERGIRQFMDIFESYGIPVAAVYGNHDDQDTPYTKEMQMDIYMEYKCFIGCKGVVASKTVGKNTMTNVGTYNIPVFESKDSDKVIFNVWGFDSGNYNPDDSVGGYGYVLPEQLDYYVSVSNALAAQNGGTPVPSIAFQHIVPPQIYRALKEVPAGTDGAVPNNGKYYVLPDSVDKTANWLSEAPCPPNVNFEPGYAQVDTMLQQGDMVAIFFGHDHINNYIVPYEGIDLVSSPGCTFRSYNDEHRGFRTITIKKDNPAAYETEILDAYSLFEGDALRTAMLKLSDFGNLFINFFKDLWTDTLEPFFNKIFKK